MSSKSREEGNREVGVYGVCQTKLQFNDQLQFLLRIGCATQNKKVSANNYTLISFENENGGFDGNGRKVMQIRCCEVCLGTVIQYLVEVYGSVDQIRQNNVFTHTYECTQYV